MIERASEFGAQPSAPPTLPGDRSHMSAGDMLREAREAHNLPQDVVAAALKVSVAKLEALETDNIDALPDPVFARALAASLCRALRIDPAPVLAKMPGVQTTGLANADRTISKNLRSAAPRAAAGPTGLPSRALLVVVVLLLVGAGVLFWMPQSVFDRVGASFSRSDSGTASESADAGGPSASVASGDASAAPAGMVVQSVTPTTPGVATVPGLGSVSPATGSATSAAASAPASAPAAPLDAAAGAASANLISFSARDDSWVTVTDSGGKPLLRRTVKAGETASVSGTPPLAVTVGRASSVTVQVRGKPFDLAPLTKGGGVARFEVKP
ncbi:Cytoskeleton protein RodZ [Burkholderiales bacterium 8X]|nr:Cytoskeleton protein RodZ [Burkholderiales bacterium 8X]